jgi:hydroxypyruvate isomerase
MNTNRRNFLARTGAGTMALASIMTGRRASAATGGASGALARASADPSYRVRNSGVKHTLMGWCWKPMDTLVLAKHAKEIGLKGIEGIDRKHYKEVREMGLEISLVGSHGFAKGPCNPEFRDEVVSKLEEAIDVAAEVGCKKVITFTGMRFEGMDRDAAARGCIEVWKRVLPKAEKRGVTLVLEHLNSRDGSHPMKGHPGYFGDDVDFCVDLIRQVGSPNFKLLFDIYHVSIMNGDVIRRLRQHREFIGHLHTAGNPGRRELDDEQEIFYPAVMKAVLEIGYHDFVAHEFIPTWDDPILALRHAVMVCDV